MKRLYYILSILLFAVAVHAQISCGGAPMPFDVVQPGCTNVSVGTGALKSSTPKALCAYDFFTKLNVDTVYHAADPTEKGFVAGNVCEISITPENSGTVFSSNGYRVWRTGVTSPGAEAISLLFTEFNIPEGAKLFLYNPSQSIILGAFSSENNNPDNVLPIQPLAADTVIVEYQEPVTSGSKFNGKLKIGYASHNFITTNGYLKKTNPEGGIKCCQDAYIADSENPVVNSVCLIYVTATAERKSYYGSGTLVNNPDGKPYILSAYHVFLGSYASTSIYYFQNHKVLDDVSGSSELSMAGASIVAQAEDIDLELVELHSMPPKDYRPYLAGWDANEDAGYKSPYKCLHHPYGDFTKLTTATVTAATSKADFDTSTFPYKTFWKISRWSNGATQGGSSGSALLNSDGKIIGCLTGGSSTCSSPVNDYFWQLSSGWDFHADSQMRLKDWLDPHNAGIKSMDGADPYAASNPCKRVSNFVDDDNIDAQRLSGGATGYQAGHNSLGCTGYAELFEFEKDKTLYGVYVGTFKGKYSSTHPVYVKILSGTDAGVIATADFKPMDYNYKYDGTLSSSLTTKWTKRDTYIRFSQPVNVGRKCYVAVTFDNYASPDTLALYQTVNRSSGNHAYYNLGGAWNAFTSYPYNPQPSSLWICPVVSDDSSAEIHDVNADSDDTMSLYVVADVADNMLKIFSTLDDDAMSYSIYDLDGEIRESGSITFTNGMASIGFDASNGIYVIALHGATTAETSKFLWR